MSDRSCDSCDLLRAQLQAALAGIQRLEQERDQLHAQLHDAQNLAELLRADLERHRAAYERIQPNTPERVPVDQLQLAFERVLETLQDAPAAKLLSAVQDSSPPPETGAPDPAAAAAAKKDKKPSGPHGRRRLDLLNLPVQSILIDPDEVVDANGAGFELIGEEKSSRVAFRPGSFMRLEIVRRTWARVGEQALLPAEASRPAIVTAPLPESVWPMVMADPSAIAQVIVGKYDDSLPLHRQERISARHGFVLPRSTQCEWLGAACAVLERVTDAMMKDAIRSAFCIAMDATGAPVRASGRCDRWHVFVFIADRDHVVFRYSEAHTSAAVTDMLTGFRGYLLADAAPIHDALFADGEIVEVACWFHQRRYFWRALGSERELALQALSLIARLFRIDRECREIPEAERTAVRTARAQPVLDMLDAWVARHRERVDPRGHLDKAIGYYDNQREALHSFLQDGRLRLDNSISEQQLRNVVLGRHNWMFFANETGLRWYTTFRSLISSCALHGLNAQQYLEQLMRLAPHWPVNRILELAPKYWSATVAKLDERQRAILAAPWEHTWPALRATDPPIEAAA